MQTFKVVKPGLFTTIQDLGRPGYQRFGLPTAGPMDSYSLRMANLLAGNDLNAAALEMAFAGATLEVMRQTVVALTGASMQAALNGASMPAWQGVRVREGDRLELGSAVEGVYSYLAVAGGIDVPPVFGSRSTDVLASIGGIEGRPLKSGDIVETYAPEDLPDEIMLKQDFISSFPPKTLARVIMGPQDKRFTAAGLDTFLNSIYKVTVNVNRIGYKLEGPQIEHLEGADIITEGQTPGAIQVPRDGRPIILLADRGSVGGYTKIAVVISADIRKVAQSGPGKEISFQAVDLETARRAYREEEAIFMLNRRLLFEP